MQDAIEATPQISLLISGIHRCRLLMLEKLRGYGIKFCECQLCSCDLSCVNATFTILDALKNSSCTTVHVCTFLHLDIHLIS